MEVGGRGIELQYLKVGGFNAHDLKLRGIMYILLFLKKKTK